MVTKIKRIGERPELIFGRAAASIMYNLGNELEYTTKQTVKASKSIAPVYNPAKYPMYNNAYTRGAHGLLKASIKYSRVARYKHTLCTNIYSRKSYAGYVENGFFHKQANRRIRGRFYIGVPIRIVHVRLFKVRIEYAFTKSFK